MTEEVRLQRWSKWTETIKDDLWGLFHHHYIFWEVQAIIKANERLAQTPSHFFQWFGDVFAYSSAMYVRRQADRTKGTVSFYKLLEEVHRYPALLTRERFLRVWGYSEREEGIFAYETKKIGDELFDNTVGKGKDHLTKAQVKTDIDCLKSQLKLIEDYANDYVAHRSEKPTGSDLPTFKNLKDSMKFLEKLLQKYYLIISGWKMSDINIDSTFTYDWKRIFTFAWIESEGVSHPALPSRRA